MKDKAPDDLHLPVLGVTALVMLVIGAFGWAFLAAGYAHAEEGWRDPDQMDLRPDDDNYSGRRGVGTMQREAGRAFADFMGNALKQLPKFPIVISYSLTHQLWLVILFVVLELLALAGGFGLKAVERNLAKPVRRPRSKGTKRYKMNTPQVDD